MKIILLIITICLNYNIYAFSFSSIFSTHKHKKVAAKSPNYTNAKQEFAKYCTKNSAAYGVQIRCVQIDAPTIFKFDTVEAIKCKQKIKGIHNLHPEQVNLPHGFIKQMNLCADDKILGPNILHTTNVTESGTGTGIQRNQTETFYDVICNNSQNYVGSMYKNKQAQYDAATANKLGKCLTAQDIEATSYSLRYIMIFEILVGLSIFSFLLRFYFKYRSSINKLFTKCLRK